MSDIFEEVDEAVTQDKVTGMWKRVSPFLYTIIGAIIIGVAVFEFMKWQSTSEQKKTADEFYLARQALETNNYVEAEAIFSTLAEGDDHVADLASHYLAQARIEGFGDKAKAIDALKLTAEGEGPFALAARLKAAYLMADDTPIEELTSWLSPLTSDGSSPFFYLAEEVLASKAFSDGDIEAAKQKYSAISLGLDVPTGVQQRAEQASAVLEAMQSKNGNE